VPRMTGSPAVKPQARWLFLFSLQSLDESRHPRATLGTSSSLADSVETIDFHSQIAQFLLDDFWKRQGGSVMLRILAAVGALLLSAMPAHAQERIVGLGGDVTEILYAVGAGPKLVATDDASLYPEAASNLPKVGYVRRLSAEGVLSVEPDLIIVSGAAGPPTALDQIRASGVPILSLDTDYTPQGILRKIDAVADAVGRQAEGRQLRQSVEQDIARTRQAASVLGENPKMLFFAATRDGAPRAAGEQTAAHGVIEMLGGTNVFTGQTGYKTLSLEAAVAADPDVIILMTHHADRVGGMAEVRSHPALALTTAAKKNRVVGVDQYTVMQFSPRTPAAVADVIADIAAKQNDD